MANEGLLIERCIVGTQEVITYSVDAVVVQLRREKRNTLVELFARKA